MSSTSAPPASDRSAETHGPGAWFHNPATGELAQIRVTPAETDGRELETDLYPQPGAAVAGAHVHPHVLERFEVLAGRVGFMIDGSSRESVPGDGPFEVPAGTPHDWWHVGDEVAHVRVRVEAAPDAPGRPADRFVSMIEALWSLGALGRVNAKSMPAGSAPSRGRAPGPARRGARRPRARLSALSSAARDTARWPARP